MSSIEQAARRLEELRRAGAEMPPRAGEGGHAGGLPTPEALVRSMELREAAGIVAPEAPAARHEPRAPAHPAHAPEPSDRHLPVRHVSLDLARLRTMGFVTPDNPTSRIADEFRVIKRPIIRNAFGHGDTLIKHGNLVMVTSALPGEGKTFTSVNLALSLAMEFNTTVLLVDGDVAHPTLPSLLGIPGEPGLLELLTGSISVPDALLKTDVERLSIIPAGSRHRRANELLASAQMASVLHELSTRYSDRIVVFDSPPLLATTEARVMAAHMGQVVMVVAADSTSQHAVTTALSTIDSCEVVLMMLNKSSTTAGVGAYYGYYGNGADS